MKIQLKATQLDLTPAIKDYIDTKIGSLDKILTPFEQEGEKTLQVEIARTTHHHRKGDVFYAEANLQLGKKVLRAEHTDIDIRAAIDKVKDMLGNEIKKYKDMHSDH